MPHDARQTVPDSKAIRNGRQERQTKCKTQEYGTEGQQYRGATVFFGRSKLMHNSYGPRLPQRLYVVTPEQATRQKPEFRRASEFAKGSVLRTPGDARLFQIS